VARAMGLGSVISNGSSGWRLKKHISHHLHFCTVVLEIEVGIDNVQLLNVIEELHKRVLPLRIVLQPIPESSRKVHQLFKCEPCFGEITTDENIDVSSQAEERFRDHYNKWQVV
jgi:hypothetical protein